MIKIYRKFVPILTLLIITILPTYVKSQTTDIETKIFGNEESSFIEVENGGFTLDGHEFRFAGTNAYYLPNYIKIDRSVVHRAFDTFKAAGVKVVRMWAFYDGFDCGYSAIDPNENVIQISAGVYNEQALIDLDYVIALGNQYNIRFILPFTNYWDELGGICQYNTWAGADKPSNNMEFFMTNENTQIWFKKYIHMLLNRVNTFTGVAYKDEPAIFSWQIINEGRNPGNNPEVLRDWYTEIAKYIKSIDQNHLVGTGEEGFDHNQPAVYSLEQYSNRYPLRANEGTSYLLNTSIPEIDYGNAHWYPSEYGYGHTVTQNLLLAQDAWLKDHAKIARMINKPFILGEYGFPGWGDERVYTVYTMLWETAVEINLDGSLLWQLTSDYTKCTESGGNICWPAGRIDTKLFLRFLEHNRHFNAVPLK